MSCTCGKIRYSSKRAAKLAARRFRGRVGRLNAYQCAGGFWHIGHLPKVVISGEISRDEIRAPRRTETAHTPTNGAK